MRPDTLNLDETRLEAAHHAAHQGDRGRALRGRRLRDGRDPGASPTRRGIAVIEDNAHGLFGRYRGRPLGSFGAMATQSFHETKNITCGEGGALLLNDAALVERAEIMREKGTNRAAFFRGQVDKYTWVDVGSSWLPSELLAAFLFAQLEAREAIQAKRRAVWERYREGLADWAARNGVALPTVPAHCEQPYHMFHLVLPQPRRAHALHRRPAGAGLPRGLPLPAAACVAHGPLARRARGAVSGHRARRRQLVRLPFYNELTPVDQDAVIEAIQDFAP